jgi:hypothetical protein
VRLTRRALLGLALLTAAGCGKHHKDAATTPPGTSAPVPDEAALQLARDNEQVLLASYAVKIKHAKAAARPQLEVERAIHAAHLSALHAAKPDGADIAVVSNLPRELRRSAHQLRGLALAATEGPNAALFASIAASHEVSTR